MLISIALGALGCLLLTAGGESLVRGSSTIARRMGISPLVVGLTIVAFGTSSPELAVSLRAAWAGTADIALGNVVGSNIFNVTLVLGLAAMILPLRIHLQVIRWDIPIMLIASVVLVAFMFTGAGLGRYEGAVLIAALAAYTWLVLRLARREAQGGNAPPVAEPESVVRGGPWLPIGVVIVGVALLVFGASLMVDAATDLARMAGISEAVIGLTIVALGTSLPELVTSIMSAVRGQPDLAVGNVIGSSIFNALGIAGASAIASPTPAVGIQPVDLAFMLGTSALILPLCRSGFVLRRWEGCLLVGLYGAYLAVTWASL